MYSGVGMGEAPGLVPPLTNYLVLYLLDIYNYILYDIVISLVPLSSLSQDSYQKYAIVVVLL